MVTIADNQTQIMLTFPLQSLACIHSHGEHIAHNRVLISLCLFPARSRDYDIIYMCSNDSYMFLNGIKYKII